MLNIEAYKNGAYNTPVWNDVISDKHVLAREAFLHWVYFVQPQRGAAFI